MTYQGATIGPTRWKSCHAGCAQASVASSSGVESSCLWGMHFACGLVSHGCCGGGGEDKLLLGIAPNKLLGDEPAELLAIEAAELLGIEPRSVDAK